MNLKRQSAARLVVDEPDKNKPRLIWAGFPPRPDTAQIIPEAPLRVKAAIIPVLAALPEYADVSDDKLIEMARQKTFRRLSVPDRWVAIALLLGAREILPIHLRKSTELVTTVISKGV